MIHLVKEKFIQAGLFLVIGLGAILIIFLLKMLRIKEEEEQTGIYR